MKSIHDDSLKALYQRATRGLPNDADQRISIEELVLLARSESLGARQSDALNGLAASSEQALTLRVLAQTNEWSQELAQSIAAARAPSLLARVRTWWESAGMPPVFASAGIALMAVIGFQMLDRTGPLPLPQTVQTPTESPLFDGAFEAGDELFAASLENGEKPDQMFNGNFDS